MHTVLPAAQVCHTYDASENIGKSNVNINLGAAPLHDLRLHRINSHSPAPHLQLLLALYTMPEQHMLSALLVQMGEQVVTPFMLVIIGISIVSRGEVRHVVRQRGQWQLLKVGVLQGLSCCQALLWVICQQTIQQTEARLAELWELLQFSRVILDVQHRKNAKSTT